MSKKNIMRPSAEVIAIIIHRERMPDTDAQDALDSNPSIMYDPSTHVLE